MSKLKGFWSRQKKPGYIDNKQKFQLAFPQMPLAISNGLIHSAYIKFYTDIVGLDIQYVGIIWMLFGIWNAVNDPLMGVFIDRFGYKPKRGKFTYLLRVTAPVTVLASAVMLYAQPDWPNWLIFGFLTVLLFVFDTTQTGYAISYGNYVLVSAPTSEERLDVSVVTMYAGQLGAFLSMIIPTLLLVGDVDRTLVVVLFTVVILINSLLYFLALRPLKESPEMFHNLRTEQGKLVEQLRGDARSLVRSKAFVAYLAYQIIGRGATVILFTQLLYMADHVLGMKGVQTTLLDVVPGLVMFLFLPLYPKLSRVFGMRNTILLASVPLGLSYMSLYFANGFWPAMFVYIGIIVFTNVGSVVGGPLFGAIIDEDERRTGVRKAGLFTGMNALLTIPVGGLHTVVFTSLLAFYGFTSGAEVQTEAAIQGIRVASSLLPGVLILLGIIPLFFLPIGKKAEKELSDFSERMHRGNRAMPARRTSWDAEGTFFSRRASLGKAWIVDLGGTSSSEKLFMRTFQGMVNRREARLYLIDSDHAEFGAADRFWIEEYERQGWVEIAGRPTLEEALERFGPELRGYVTATEKEPWSIHAAAVVAMLKDGVVAPDDVALRLKRLGWRELEDVRGKWTDAVSAFRDMVDLHGKELAYPGLALIRPGENLWDFLLQQQIMPVFSRPKHDTWEGVAKIMDAYPGQRILYGYVSDDTVEEEIAVERASASGKYLVPTHQVSNLSFHSAVLGDSALLPVKQRVEERVEDRDEERVEQPIPARNHTKVDIVLAITDGDNLQVPILQYPLPGFWNSKRRGSLPLGWSMGVSLSTLAPGIWEYYRRTLKPSDEIVSIMGIAYVHASTLPDPERYFVDSFSSMKDMGLHTLWSLDSSLTITDEPLWDVLEKAPSREVLKGVLVGYGPSVDKAFRRETGTPVLIPLNGYSEDAERLKERIEAILAMDPADRCPVYFLMATNWSTNAEELCRVLKPLEDKGVRFLTPSQALAMLPDIRGLARSSVDATAPPGQCLPVGSVAQFGSPILSAPTLAEISKPMPLPLLVSVEAGGDAASAATVEFTARLEVPVDELARVFLADRVLPVVEGYGLSSEFAEFAWMKLAASGIRVDLPLPGSLGGGGILSVEADGCVASAAFVEGALRVTLDSFVSDSRISCPSIRVTIRFTLLPLPVETMEGLGKLRTEPAGMTFDFALTIGIGEEEGPLVGGVKGRMAGRERAPWLDGGGD